METKFFLRAGQAGAIVQGEPGEVLTFQSDGTVRGQPNAVVSVAFFRASPDASAEVNNVALAAACAYAVAIGAELSWPAGVYQTDASIPLLHSVRHRGAGAAIQRGANLFYVEPAYNQTNRLFVDAAGVAGRDGLGTGEAMALPQNAFDALRNYGPTLEGTWRVVFGAGTWAGTVHRNSHTTPSKNPVILEGPDVGGHPNVPTAIFTGTVGAVADDWCMRATGDGVQVDWRNLKAQGYTGSGATGFLADYGAGVYWTNLHGSGNAYSDVYFQGCTVVRGGGGIWASPRGALINGCIDTTVGYGAIPVRCNGNTNAAIEWSRGTEGHVDYCEFNDCKIGVDVMHNSRVHLMGNNFKRSTTAAVRNRTTGYFYNDLATPNNFNNGTADKNAINFLNYAGSGESDEDLFLSQSSRRRAFNKNSSTLTGTTALTAMSTLLSGVANSRIPAYWFEDNTKRILVRVTGQFTTAAALSSIGVTLGATEIDRITLVAPGPAANSIFFYECEIEAVGPNAQFKKSRLWVDGMYSRLQQNSPTVPTNVDLAVVVNGKLAASGDSMSVFWSEVWLVG